MKRRCAFGVVLAVAACLAVAGFAVPLLPVAPQDQAATSAPPLTASGVIEATVVRLAHEFGGEVEAIHVEEGARVRRGQRLVTLDSAAVAAQLAEAEAEVAAAQAELDLLLAGPREEEVRAARAALARAQSDAEGAYAQRQNALAMVENPQDLNTKLAQANAQARLADQGVEKTSADLARLELESNGVSGDVDPTRRTVLDYQLAAACEALAAAEADRNAAYTLVGQLRAIINNPLHLVAQANQAEGAYRLAAQAVAVAQAELDDLLAGPTPEEINVARANLAFVAAQADAYHSQLTLYDIESPLDGIVIERLAHPGETVAAGAPILSLADLSQLTLTVYIPSPDLGRVTQGQAVTVAVDSFPGQTFRGVVRRVADEAEYTPRNVTTRDERANVVFAVAIWLANPDLALKPGMPADATFGPPEPALMLRARPADLLARRDVSPTAAATHNRRPSPPRRPQRQ
ncbi:MAG: efflux RND transporter periplasmic adaptor subunit [Anaerolineae bacterium]|nr:efflux RND transporter periplasmic adaptor subunit [Anaerolineae bacterium]